MGDKVLRETESGIVYPDTRGEAEKEQRPQPLGPKDYLTHCQKEYVRPDGHGWTDIEVLEFLKGEKWDQMALNYVHALRPSSIRVTPGIMTADARTWRVTVTVDENDRIRSITQEVEVGLVGGYQHGHDLDCKRRARKEARDGKAEAHDEGRQGTEDGEGAGGVQAG